MRVCVYKHKDTSKAQPIVLTLVKAIPLVRGSFLLIRKQELFLMRSH